MAGIFDLSTDPGSNTTIGGITAAEGMTPGLVNNLIRALASLLPTSFTSALENFFNGTAALPIANGGTAATSAPAALTSLGALAVTYRDLPVTAKTAAFSFADSDRGTLLRYTGGAASLTINTNATTAINTGGVIVVYNAGSGALTTAKAVGVTLKIAGQTTNADLTLAVGGYAAFIKSDTNEWVAVGAGIS